MNESSPEECHMEAHAFTSLKEDDMMHVDLYYKTESG